MAVSIQVRKAIVDNLDFHQMKLVRNAIEAVGATPIYPPTYSIELNPIGCGGRTSNAS